MTTFQCGKCGFYGPPGSGCYCPMRAWAPRTWIIPSCYANTAPPWVHGNTQRMLYLTISSIRRRQQ